MAETTIPAPALAALMDWYQRSARPLPWRADDFGAWGILVSEIMLQQTQVSRVIPALEAWLNRWPTPADFAAASPAEVLRAWDRLGYPRRALALQRAAAVIAAQHKNRVPDRLDDLLALPGIGDYTARAVLVFAYGQHEPVVDTNTRRVIARAVRGRAAAAAPSKRDLVDMAALLPEQPSDSTVVNAAMMELGATICTARNPGCDRCPIQSVCRWRALGYPIDDTPPVRRQARFQGSDRQARGLLMAALRASPAGVAESALLRHVSDPVQAARALASLLADGLACQSGSNVRLPD